MTQSNADCGECDRQGDCSICKTLGLESALAESVDEIAALRSANACLVAGLKWYSLPIRYVGDGPPWDQRPAEVAIDQGKRASESLARARELLGGK